MNGSIIENVLSDLMDSRETTTIYLRNGFQMRGTIDAYDGEAVVVNCGGVKKVVFRHVISTISYE